MTYYLIVGSRTFDDYEFLKSKLDEIITQDDVCIVSGGAKGADSLAEKYAYDNGYKLEVFKANWKLYGKRAGFIRNQEMHEYISKQNNRKCIAFWDGISKGTSHSFELAEKYSNPITIINI